MIVKRKHLKVENKLAKDFMIYAILYSLKDDFSYYSTILTEQLKFRL